MVLIGLLGSLSLLLEMPGNVLLLVLAIGLFFPIAIIYTVAKKQPAGYMILSFFMVKGILDSLEALQQETTPAMIGIAINVAILVFAVFLKLKLYPYQNFFQNKKSENGHFVFK